MVKKIFILGTGRSGTHFVGNIIAAQENVEKTIESPEIFNLVTEAAVFKKRREYLIPKIIDFYNSFEFSPETTHYIDKSHPLLWIAEEIDEKVDNTFFISVVRNPFAVVASTLKHKGVRAWLENWKDYPIPNEFLGIDNENINSYSNMSIEGKAAMRWISHMEEIYRLKIKGMKNFMVVRYEDLFYKKKETVKKISEFLELDVDISKVHFEESSLNKWIKNLNSKQKNTIIEVLRNSCDHDVLNFFYPDIV